jgi:hypothetical protein
MENRDKFITEMLGGCWHDFTYASNKIGYVCKWCEQKKTKVKRNNFSTPEGFFKLWNFCKEQEWWGSFIQSLGFSVGYHWVEGYEALIRLIDDKGTFANAVARFRGWKEGE